MHHFELVALEGAKDSWMLEFRNEAVGEGVIRVQIELTALVDERGEPLGAEHVKLFAKNLERLCQHSFGSAAFGGEAVT
jgi:hypothetical protein